MKRPLLNKIAFTLTAVAIFLVGMLRDPDLANGNDLDAGPIAHERLPGYQFVPDATTSQPLTEAEIAKLNAPANGDVPTF